VSRLKWGVDNSLCQPSRPDEAFHSTRAIADESLRDPVGWRSHSKRGTSIRKWVQANAPGAPAPLANVLQWYVTRAVLTRDGDSLHCSISAYNLRSRAGVRWQPGCTRTTSETMTSCRKYVESIRWAAGRINTYVYVNNVPTMEYDIDGREAYGCLLGPTPTCEAWSGPDVRPDPRLDL